MTTFQINKESNIAGKTLKTLRVREKWESTSLLLREENNDQNSN
jgi:hypothetical protein